jgi:hypothetical protein
MERFNLKKYHVEISNKFAALENLDTEVDINKANKQQAETSLLGPLLDNKNERNALL